MKYNIHWKNVMGVSFAMFLSGSSFITIQNIASSLYAKGGLGLASLSTAYGVYAVSSLLSPIPLQYLGTKWVMVLTCTMNCVFFAMNFYPQYYTLIPGAAITGLAAGPIWAAQGVHLTTTAINYADITLESQRAVISRFHGAFNLLFLGFAQVPGNLISSLVLYSGLDENKLNRTDLAFCGAPRHASCGNSPANSTSLLTEDYRDTLHIIFGILLVWGALAIPIAVIFMDNLKSYCPVLPTKRNIVQQLKSTFRLSLSPKMFLIIPLIFYNGIELGFVYGDFTRAYVSCTQGLQAIGFVMTAYGVSGGISALTVGILNKYTGRIPLFTAAFISHIALMLLMIFWDPQTGEIWQLYLMAITWAFGASLRESQIGAFIGALFPKDQEPAYANYRLWTAVSIMVSFASSIPASICILYKLIVLICFLCLSMVSYYCLEWRLRYVEEEETISDIKSHELKKPGFDEQHEKMAKI